MPKTSGSLRYRCRACAAEFDACGVPDLLIALSSILIDGATPREWGIQARLLDTHYCGPGRIGIADLIGGREG